MSHEQEFQPFRAGIVGIDARFRSPYGERPVLYADWTASGRLYAPIERRMLESFGPFVGNTHSESSVTGELMTHSYHHAHSIIKRHVHASEDDMLLFVGTGMTAAICKLQRILGLKFPERYRDRLSLNERDKPVVFVTHMEHHSNQTTWYETIADVHVIQPTPEGLVDEDDLRRALRKYADRSTKIGSFSACSNVTGISPRYGSLAKIMHEHGGIAIVDFAACAPYVDIDMHPSEDGEHLDAILFSPHKFLGGPGTPGVLVFNRSLYQLQTPDQPGGGTVLWTDPWGRHRFSPDIEVREDGGTPGFLQAVRASFAVLLKEHMGPSRMKLREEELVATMFRGLREVPRLHLLADHIDRRLPIFSFYFEHIHYNLVVKLLNDLYGIQARGGCSCAGTYGHYLLHVDKRHSRRITAMIDAGDLSAKPGWVRISLHPTTTDREVETVLGALNELSRNVDRWREDYTYCSHTNEFHHASEGKGLSEMVSGWFAL